MESTLTPDDIRAWLVSVGQTRAWLAAKVGVKPSTIDNWLNRGRPIPTHKAVKIRSLMVGRSTYREVIAVPVRFTSEEWEEVCQYFGVKTLEEAEEKLRKFALVCSAQEFSAALEDGDAVAADDAEE